MTRDNDEGHPSLARDEGQTRDNGGHLPCCRWSDDGHHERHPRDTLTRDNGLPPIGGSRPVCRCFGAGFRWSEGSARRSPFFPPLPEIAISGLREEFSPRVAELGGSA
jgi:hypothetical protein